MNNEKLLKLPKQVEDITSQLDSIVQETIPTIKANATLRNTKIPKFLDFKNLKGSDFRTYQFKTASASSDGEWVVENNQIKPTYTDGSKVGTFAYFKNDTIQDGKISCIINGWTWVGTGSYFGIVLRGEDENNYLMAIFSNQNKTINLMQRTNGVSKAIGSTIDVTTHTSLSNVGEPIKLSVEFVGGNVDIYMNNAKVYSISESVDLRKHKSNGLFGLVMVCNGSTTLNQNITFSNVVYEKYKFNVIKGDYDKCLSVGDSVTAGSGASSNAKCWISLLRSHLQSKNPNFILDNMGIGGINTNRMKYEIINNIKLKDYDICTIMIGINDSRIDNVGLTHDVSIENFAESIRVCKENNVIPVVLLSSAISPLVDRPTLNRTSWVYLQKLANEQRRICGIEDVICIDTNDIFDIATDLDVDTVHPNDSGHNKIFNTAKTIF